MNDINNAESNDFEDFFKLLKAHRSTEYGKNGFNKRVANRVIRTPEYISRVLNGKVKIQQYVINACVQQIQEDKELVAQEQKEYDERIEHLANEAPKIKQTRHARHSQDQKETQQRKKQLEKRAKGKKKRKKSIKANR